VIAIVKRLHISLALLLLAGPSLVRAQYGIEAPPLPTKDLPRRPKPHVILDSYPLQPSIAPTFTIPVGPLGFSVPGDNYLLRRQSLLSLDFLDEDRLLFTFHVSGLMARDAGDDLKGTQQQIQAKVVIVSTGKIESEAAWIVPDRSRYLWMLNDGHFLLRTREGLDQGDANLKTAPFLRFPGRLLWIQLAPKEKFIMANSLETATASQKPDSSATGQPSASADPPKPGEQSVLVTRTLKRASGEVTHESRVPWTNQDSNWPMNSDGYVERLHDDTDHWHLELYEFAGSHRPVVHMDSTCLPQYSFLSETELLVTRCQPDEGLKLGAISTQGSSLWEMTAPSNVMWPLLVTAPNGLRAARQTMLLKHAVKSYKKKMLSAEDFQGQMVRVFDVANGKTVLEAPLTPILDAGGNVAISPSGQRVAILNAGAIQIFQLAAPPPTNASRHRLDITQ
jgi:hypothetical protein